ncbi:amidohydrolase, imidazolonepropionase [Terriglobus roseus DSM 18391]|uniref:Amidohydrolase, imidazolonepropionase n=1 Tax=Terriglobus roseus (strain DSM 18391 / NRRL B-41598 / KBS 63) TaxID=926566 RepID=I3ZHE6_TERRK|nr:amidohydrolase family protein [Terriglobus roseus]AFL88322.1 amidohydrolase, imidazolonepropionase [Terriglobus roseus DSM 18391]AFL88664.1 amidohydrolase, imidazolonepropionase [Terriglobus roseus DSM 18391]
MYPRACQILVFISGGLFSALVHAQVAREPAVGAVTLFQNVRVLQKSGQLSAPSYVLVRGNRIERIATSAVPTDRSASTRIIEGGGRTLMPGLIDAHTHILLQSIPMSVAMTADIGYLNLVAGQAASEMLLRGFTTIRDLGGPSFGLKMAIDQGLIPGPRIVPSGAFISQTSGHGDFRMPYEIPRTVGTPLSHSEQEGVAAIADGSDEVRLRAREQLMKGATQIKLMAGGGVASPYDPLDVAQYTEFEFRAAVEAAENWGTYVTVHAYTPKAIRTAIAGGVKCIEHGQLADDASAKLMADKGIWWSLQPFLDDEDANPQPAGSTNRQKQLEMSAGTDTAYKLAKKYKVKTAWGTDTLFDAKLASRQGAQLAKMVRWYTPSEILTMATADNAELLAMAGARNPYPGRLGVVEEGALADLLLVDGDPIANIQLITNPGKNLLVIMKDGVIYKNQISLP